MSCAGWCDPNCLVQWCAQQAGQATLTAGLLGNRTVAAQYPGHRVQYNRLIQSAPFSDKYDGRSELLFLHQTIYGLET